MNTRMGLRFGLSSAAAVIALAFGLLIISQVSAGGARLSLGSTTVNPDESGTVDLNATGFSSPGLGAWEIGVIYDSDVVSAVSCSSAVGSVCNADFAPGRVQVVGADADGLVGSSTLASITFRCNTEGQSTLSFVIDELADATTNDPMGILPALQNGRITCEEAEGLPDRPTRPPRDDDDDDDDDADDDADEPTQIILPSTGTGTGTGTGGGTMTWAIATLAGVGLAFMAGLGAMRLRTLRSRDG